MPTSLVQVEIILLFITPGFIFSRVLGFSVPQRSRDALSMVLDSLAASSFSYALISPLIWFLVRNDFTGRHPIVFCFCLILVLFIWPVALAVLAIQAIENPRFSTLRRLLKLAHPIPKAWDYFFRAAGPCWVRATLKDGTLVAGLFGVNSFASSYPDAEDLYLERLCALFK